MGSWVGWGLGDGAWLGGPRAAWQWLLMLLALPGPESSQAVIDSSQSGRACYAFAILFLVIIYLFI